MNTLVYDSGTFGEVEKILIIPFHEVENLGAALEEEMIKFEKGYKLSIKSSCSDSINFIENTFNDTILYNEETLLDLLEKLEFKSASYFIENQKRIDSKSSVSAHFYNEAKDLFEHLEILKVEFYLNTPFTEKENWLNEDLKISKRINFKSSSFNHNPIKSIISEKIKLIEEIEDHYNNNSRASQKLFLMSLYFLICTDIEIKKKNYTNSIIFLHRSIENSFLFNLNKSGAISFDKEGKINSDRDRHKYLLDYMNMVKMNDGIDDKLSESTIKLNQLRNNCKLAHGYRYIDVEAINDIISPIRNYILNNDSGGIFRKLQSIVFMNEKLSILAKNFLIQYNYIEKF